MKAKSKSKRNVRKFSRLKINQKEETPGTDDSVDLSNLRKPIATSLSTLRQVSKLFDNATNEVKSILDYECEVIYECRICRSLFRSLANFISHKRVYCTDKYDVSVDKNAIDPPGMVRINYYLFLSSFSIFFQEFWRLWKLKNLKIDFLEDFC